MSNPTIYGANTSNPTLFVSSGNYVNLLDPHSSQFTIEDIAHGLSQCCRFAGQGKWYSVAEHSIHVSRHVPPEDAMAALLHDASEAFLGDVTRPLKALLPGYKTLERRFQVAIWSRLGEKDKPRLPETVRKVDRQMLRLEQIQVMGNHDRWEGAEDGLSFALDFLDPREAKRDFLDRYHEIQATTI